MIININHKATCLTGSNYICSPKVENTDIDIAYLVDSLTDTNKVLLNKNWNLCNCSHYACMGWAAYRKGKYNLIIFENKDIYDRFEAATELAKKRNLVEKKDRLALFATIVGKMTVEPELF